MLEHEAVKALRTYVEGPTDAAAPIEHKGPVDLVDVERRTLLLRVAELEDALDSARWLAREQKARADLIERRANNAEEIMALDRKIGPRVPIAVIDEAISHMTLASVALIRRSHLARVKLANSIDTLLALKKNHRATP